MSAQHECNVYLMREGGRYIDCRKIDSHVDLHAGPDDEGYLVTWSSGSPRSGRHVSGPGFNRPVAPNEYNTQEEVPRKELEAQLVDCRNMICDLREENEGLKTRIEKMKAKLGRKQHVIDTHVKFIQRLTDERDQYRRANVELEKDHLPSDLANERIVDLTVQRDTAVAEQGRAEARANAFQRIAQGYEMLWKGAIGSEDRDDGCD